MRSHGVRAAAVACALLLGLGGCADFDMYETSGPIYGTSSAPPPDCGSLPVPPGCPPRRTGDASAGGIR